MTQLQYHFNETPLYVISTKIPRPQLQEGVHQKLDGLTSKTTQLILANEPNILKYLTVESPGQPLEVRQLIGGLSIISRETLIATLKVLKHWEQEPELQNVTFFDSMTDANQVLQKLTDAQGRYFSGLLEETKDSVEPLELEVINFSNYILHQVDVYGNGETLDQLANYTPKEKIEKVKNRPIEKSNTKFSLPKLFGKKKDK